MSGIEIVGVVLGAVPIIVSALEGYQKLGKKRDAFIRKSLHIDRMVRALKWQHQLIQSDIKLVLRNAGLEESDIGRNLSGGCRLDLLTRPDIEHAVHCFLGDNYSTYIDVIQQSEKTLLTVAMAVKGLDTATGSLAAIVQANQAIAQPGNEFWKRVKFSMRKEDLEQSIKEVDELSKLLERIREKSQQDQQITVQSHSASANAFASMLRNVQIQALKLHEALTRSWNMSCQNPHKVRLYLDHRIDTSKGSTKPLPQYKSKKVQFDTTLLNCAMHSYHKCTVETAMEDNLDDSSIPNNSGVSFQIPLTTKPQSAKEKVDNLCRILSQCNKSQDSVKLYLADHEKLRYERVVADGSCLRAGHVLNGKILSLEDLLQARTLQRKPLSRVRLAALLASSALQLHSTPWWRSPRNGSLLFFQDANGELDLRNPFIACNFDRKLKAPAKPSSSQAESELLDLGILILELWANQPIEDFARDSGSALEDTSDSRRNVARKWLAEEKDEMLPSIYDSAVRCINCRFDAVDIDLTDFKLSLSVFQGVVRPLWDNCKE